MDLYTIKFYFHLFKVMGVCGEGEGRGERMLSPMLLKFTDLNKFS